MSESRNEVKPNGAKTGKPGKKAYEKELALLHIELVKLQEWVVRTGAKICIVFEGRDGAGKGGVIKALTERVNPRIFRVIALPAPTDREKTQMYFQRYLPHLPAAGVKSSCSIAVGIAGQVSNGSWAFAPRRRCRCS